MDLLAVFFADRRERKAFILKGYAGTGKTTLINSMNRSFRKMGYDVVLLAPTGRAAKVMSEYSGTQASTIHRHIYEINPARDGNVRVRQNKKPVEDTMFIVDEASMIPGKEDKGFFSGTRVLSDLIEYVYRLSNCFLIFVGDTAQLPPVGEIQSAALDVEHLQREFQLNVFSFELKEVVRQAKDSGILMNATATRILVSRGAKYPILKTSGFTDVSNPERAELDEEIRQHFDSKSMDESVIICKSNKQANQYNQFIRSRVLMREDEISSGDRIMVVRNNYFWLSPDSKAGFIANGDILIIKRLRGITERYGFRFADALVSFQDYEDEELMEVKIMLDVINKETPALGQELSKKLYEAVYEDYPDEKSKYARMKKVYADPYWNALQVKFSYAITCHKAQGGQWNHVFVDSGYMSDESYSKEYLRWLYTALTRAKQKLFFVGLEQKFFKE